VDGQVVTYLRSENFVFCEHLFGEDQGRDLKVYLKSDYYRPALESLEGKGLVRSTNGTYPYHLTDKGNTYTRGYLKWLSSSWKPGK
jgi:hypothetical protein